MRNRLTHPKSLNEQVVTKDEVNDCVFSIIWFYENTTSFINQHSKNLKNQIEKYKIALGKDIE